MTIPIRVTIQVGAVPGDTFRATAVLPSGTSVDVIRVSREDAIRECGNQCHRIAAEQGTTILTSYPFCAPDWSLPHWKLPRFRQFDPDGETDPPSGDRREGQDGIVPTPLDALPGLEPDDA